MTAARPPRCGSLSLTPSSWKMSWQHKAGDAGSLASGAAVVYPILAKELFGRGTAAGARMNGDTVHLHAPRLVLQCRVAPGELRGCGHCGLDLHDLIPAKRGRRYTHVIAVMKTLMPQLSPVSPPRLQDLSKSMKKHVRSFQDTVQLQHPSREGLRPALCVFIPGLQVKVWHHLFQDANNYQKLSLPICCRHT